MCSNSTCKVVSALHICLEDVWVDRVARSVGEPAAVVIVGLCGQHVHIVEAACLLNYYRGSCLHTKYLRFHPPTPRHGDILGTGRGNRDLCLHSPCTTMCSHPTCKIVNSVHLCLPWEGVNIVPHCRIFSQESGAAIVVCLSGHLDHIMTSLVEDYFSSCFYT